MEVPLRGHNGLTIVDDSWAHLLRYTWRVCKDGYAFRRKSGNRIFLHHIVMGEPLALGLVRDHINRNKLDNRLSNLRWVTVAENAQNRTVSVRNVTGFRGVFADATTGRYRARIQKGGKSVVDKWFKTAVEADAFLRSCRTQHLPAASE